MGHTFAAGTADQEADARRAEHRITGRLANSCLQGRVFLVELFQRGLRGLQDFSLFCRLVTLSKGIAAEQRQDDSRSGEKLVEFHESLSVVSTLDRTASAGLPDHATLGVYGLPCRCQIRASTTATRYPWTHPGAITEPQIAH